MTMTNPYNVNNFVVSIERIPDAIQFREISGLDSANTIIEYREGADPMNALRKLPGLEETKILTFKRGITHSLDLWTWRREVRDGSTARVAYRTVDITLRDGTMTPVLTWSLVNAWCSKLAGPALNGQVTGNEAIAIEQMEVSFDRIDLKFA